MPWLHFEKSVFLYYQLTHSYVDTTSSPIGEPLFSVFETWNFCNWSEIMELQTNEDTSLGAGYSRAHLLLSRRCILLFEGSTSAQSCVSIVMNRVRMFLSCIASSGVLSGGIEQDMH